MENELPDGSQCQCQEENACTSCARSGGLPSPANLRFQEELPSAAASLGGCTPAPQQSAANLSAIVAFCHAACEAMAPACSAYSVRAATSAQCCLFGNVTLDSMRYSVPGARFYTMPACDSCRTDTHYLRGASCAALSVPPVARGAGVGGQSLAVPLDTPPGTLLYDPAARTDVGPLSFRLEPPSPLLLVDPVTGRITLSPEVASPGTVSVALIVADGRTECVLRDQQGAVSAAAGPCSVQVDLVVQFLVFLGCPTDINAYISLDADTATVSWTEPRLPAAIDHLSVTRELADAEGSPGALERPPFVYPVGTRTITYTTPPLTVGSPLRCTFSVTTQHGFELEVDAIGRQQSGSLLHEYLVADDGTYSGVRQLPAFNGTVEAQRTIGMGVVAPPGTPFTLRPLAGSDVRISVLWQWCASDTSRPTGALQRAAQATARLVDVLGTPPSFTDAGSGTTNDGRCLLIRLRSEPINATLSFRQLAITFQPAQPSRRREQSAQPIADFVPVPPYALAVTAQRRDGRDQLPSAQTMSLEDTQPPIFLGCPAEGVTVAAPAGTTGVAATWTPPEALDNAVTPTVAASAEPGAVFSILGSPHRVTYTASDGRQEAKCAFDVVVLYNASIVEYATAMNTSFPRETEAQPLLHQTSHRQYLLRSDMGVLDTLQGLNTATTTELVFKLDAPPGQPVVFREVSPSLRSQLVVDVAWTLPAGLGSASRASLAVQADVGVRIEFEGYSLDSSGSAAGEGDNGQALPEMTRYAVGLARVDPSGGMLGLVRPLILPFRRGIRFSSLRIRVAVPAGRASFPSAAAEWVHTADSRVYVEHVVGEPAASLPPDGFVTLLDLEAPMWLDCPAQEVQVLTAPGSNVSTGAWTAPTAVDNRAVVAVQASVQPADALGVQLPSAAPLTVTFVAQDGFDNEAACTFPLRVVDAEPPTFVLPNASVVPLDARARAVRQRIAVARVQPLLLQDNSRLPVRVLEPTSDLELAVGTHAVGVRVADAWGNEAKANVSVTIVDDTPPTLTCPPSRSAFTLEETAEVLWGPIVAVDNDLEEPARIVTTVATPPSGSQFALGTTVVKVEARDMSGNMAACSFNVTVSGPSVRLETEAARSDNGLGTVLGGGVGGGVALLTLLILAIYVRRVRRAARAPQDWNEILSAVSCSQGQPGGIAWTRNCPRTLFLRLMTSRRPFPPSSNRWSSSKTALLPIPIFLARLTVAI